MHKTANLSPEWPICTSCYSRPGYGIFLPTSQVKILLFLGSGIVVLFKFIQDRKILNGLSGFEPKINLALGGFYQDLATVS